MPEAKLCIEINGKSKFYPYTTKYNNFLNLKHKLVIQQGHNMLHLNSWKLEGMMKSGTGKEQLRDLLTKTIGTYKEKINLS